MIIKAQKSISGTITVTDDRLCKEDKITIGKLLTEMVQQSSSPASDIEQKYNTHRCKAAIRKVLNEEER